VFIQRNERRQAFFFWQVQFCTHKLLVSICNLYTTTTMIAAGVVSRAMWLHLAGLSSRSNQTHKL